jgi:hypothetical protein
LALFTILALVALILMTNTWVLLVGVPGRGHGNKAPGAKNGGNKKNKKNRFMKSSCINAASMPRGTVRDPARVPFPNDKSR